MRRLFLLVALVPLLTGCFYLPLPGDGASSGNAEASRSETNVRAAIPAIEAYYADHGTYRGMTLELLRGTYDFGIPDVKIVRARRNTYCVESSSDGEAYSYHGPQGGLARGAC